MAWGLGPWPQRAHFGQGGWDHGPYCKVGVQGPNRPRGPVSYISPPLICARPLLDLCPAPGDKSRNPRDRNYLGSSTGKYWTVKRPINVPLKCALYLNIGLAVIIVWWFMNRGGARVVVKMGIRRVSRSSLIKCHLFPLLAPINSSFWISTSLLHSSFSKLPLCRAYCFLALIL